MKPILFLLIFAICGSASASIRTWTMKDGSTVEAEFETLMGDYVLLKSGGGKQLRVDLSRISDSDLAMIELLSPPKFEINCSRTYKTRVFPPIESSQLPRSAYYTFKAAIERGFPVTPYRHELTLEFFVIGVEVYGEKDILLDYKKTTFSMADLKAGRLEISSSSIE